MPLRPVTRDDAEALVPFVAMAVFAPGRESSPGSLQSPHARRWLDHWSDELGVVWEREGRVVGAAWARVVDPVLVRDASGQAIPEAIIAVAEQARGTGIGRRLMEALMHRTHAEGHAGLAVTVSERNPVAIRLYERVGFEYLGRTPTGLLTMLWSAPGDDTP